MIPIALIRHGPTDWNEQKRLQGHADRPLSPAGREAVSRWRLPEEFRDYDWFASPLTRAQETARMLQIDFDIEHAVIEMNWGAWEGQTRDQLIEQYGDDFSQRTARGLDLRPHDGESPREVRARFADWARSVAARGRPTGVVAHQGIIRAALSLATGWEMVGKPPAKMDWESVHVFTVSEDGRMEIGRLNVSLIPETS